MTDQEKIKLLERQVELLERIIELQDKAQQDKIPECHIIQSEPCPCYPPEPYVTWTCGNDIIGYQCNGSIGYQDN